VRLLALQDHGAILRIFCVVRLPTACIEYPGLDLWLSGHSMSLGGHADRHRPLCVWCWSLSHVETTTLYFTTRSPPTAPPPSLKTPPSLFCRARAHHPWESPSPASHHSARVPRSYTPPPSARRGRSDSRLRLNRLSIMRVSLANPLPILELDPESSLAPPIFTSAPLSCMLRPALAPHRSHQPTTRGRLSAPIHR
jgi:hypothetical protein